MLTRRRIKKPRSPIRELHGAHRENPIGTDGFEFVEYTANNSQKLAALFETLGFVAVARLRAGSWSIRLRFWHPGQRRRLRFEACRETRRQTISGARRSDGA